MSQSLEKVKTPCGCIGHHEYPLWGEGLFVILVIDNPCSKHKEEIRP